MEYRLDAVQKKLFCMMTAFDEFCHTNHLTYYLIGGSALGALRHNGFIPWDDDVDVALPRKDFERMEYILKTNHYNYLGNYFYQAVEQNGPTGHLFEKEKEKSTQRPTVDIYPLDAVPDSKFAQKIQKVICQVYHVATYRKPPKNRGIILKLLTSFFLFATNDRFLSWLKKQAKKIITKWNKRDENLLSNLFGCAGYDKEKVPASYFGTPVYHEFESAYFPIPERCHEYMTHIYGDYMKLPPVSQQKPKHRKE